MIDRIGTLNLHYLVGRGRLAPALTAGLDRALHAGLGDALGRRMPALLGDDKVVTVVRELNATVALAISGATLDSQVVDTFSRACTTALADLLSSDPDGDAVMRFDDETAFAGSFIVALLDGSAWDRWYFGAFHRYRRADARSTLRAVLEESGIVPSALFAWLARHGQLSAMLACLSPAAARALLGCGAQSYAADGTTALIDSARKLLAVLAPWDEAQFAQRIDAFLATHPIRPDWSSRTSLSAWIVQLLRFVLRVRDGDTIPSLSRPQRDALHALLEGPLDWLDSPWVEAQLCATESATPPAPSHRAGATRQLLTPRQRRILQLLVEDLRHGKLRLPASAGMDETIVHLTAMAAQHSGEECTLDRSIVTVIELAVQATQEESRTGRAPDAPGSPPGPRLVLRRPAPLPSSAAADALRGAGTAALELAGALRARMDRLASAGQESAMVGVFLLARAIKDMRLHALAQEAGVPAAPLLTGLATLWAGKDLSADCALPLWGAGEERCSGLSGDTLDGLNESLLEQLIERRMLAADDARATVSADFDALDDMPAIDARLKVTACLLLRAWAYWLPGLSGSSPQFLVRKSIRRNGSVGVSGQRIEVELDPAPLDIVLKMAGYLDPLGPTGWLGERSLVFTVRDRVRAPPP